MCSATLCRPKSHSAAWRPRTPDRYWSEAQRTAHLAERSLRQSRLLNVCRIGAATTAVMPFLAGSWMVLGVLDRGQQCPGEAIRIAAAFLAMLAMLLIAFAAHHAMVAAGETFRTLNDHLEHRLETMETAWSVVLMTRPPHSGGAGEVEDAPRRVADAAWPGQTIDVPARGAADLDRLGWHARRQALIAQSTGSTTPGI